MSTLMRTRRLLSFGASKIAADRAQMASGEAKRELERQAIQKQVNADLARCGKTTFTYPRWMDIR